MQEVDLKEITYKIDIFNVSQEAKVIQEKMDVLLSKKDKVFEALFGNLQTDSYLNIQHPIVIVEGDENLLYAVLSRFKDMPNLIWNFLISELQNNWLVIREIEEDDISFEKEEKRENSIENQKQVQKEWLIIMNEIKDDIRNQNRGVQTLLKNIENSVQSFTYKDKINKELHEELQSYKAGLREEFVKPILKSIIREYDRAVQLYEFYSRKAETEPQSELFTKLLKEFNILSSGLLDILDDYNLVPFEVHEGDEFLPREHKIFNVIKTDDISKDGKIAKCVKCGFLDTENKRLLRHAEVNLYKISNNK